VQLREIELAEQKEFTLPPAQWQAFLAALDKAHRIQSCAPPSVDGAKRHRIGQQKIKIRRLNSGPALVPALLVVAVFVNGAAIAIDADAAALRAHVDLEFAGGAAALPTVISGCATRTIAR